MEVDPRVDPGTGENAMAELRPCPYGPHSHRTKKAFRACAMKHGKAKKWTLAEIGLK